MSTTCNLIRLPDVATSNALINAAVTLFSRIPNFLNRTTAAHQYTTALVVRYTLTQHSPHPPLIFTGSKSAKFGLDFRSHSILSRPRFETE